MKSELILLMETRYGDMRASEQKAADYVIQHFDEMPQMTLGGLAKKCNVSQPTVLRMIRAVGFTGFKEFRYAVITELARTEKEMQIAPLYGYSFKKEDHLEDIPGKIVTTTAKMMEENLKNFSMKTYRSVIEALQRARMIDIYSVENSNVTARDLLTKLLYLGLDCRYMDDVYHQRICAGNLTDQDVAIGISYSGCSVDTVENIRMAKKSGATTIVITNFKDSLISRYADFLICTSQEQIFYGDAIFSRTTQLVLVDMIYMGLLVSDDSRYEKSLDRSSKMVKDKASV
ncbi:MAG: MurR/RpiR family transcriptional regulator [Anaerostipes sp.]|uniref:MurR/RpiR family transcriptional regulator n=1 Tax=Anaerostipes sp. TaxID=1872530 RepID=UPI00399114E3